VRPLETIAQFLTDERFSYRPNVIVTEVKEASNEVIVHGYQVERLAAYIAACVCMDVPMASSTTPSILASEIERRLMVLQGYIHSEQSSKIAVTLRGGPGSDTLELTAMINPQTMRVLRKVVRKLLKNALRLGVIPLPLLLKLSQPGGGYRAGGSFPMRKRPTRFESDVLGRPTGWERVHAVDATVLPSIAATTITLTVMANAHRIASEAGTIG
jgi:hypothetical protein